MRLLAPFSCAKSCWLRASYNAYAAPRRDCGDGGLRPAKLPAELDLRYDDAGGLARADYRARADVRRPPSGAGKPRAASLPSADRARGDLQRKGGKFSPAIRAKLGRSSRRLPEADGTRIEGSELVLFKRVVDNREILGTVYLRADYELYERLIGYSGIAVIVAAIAMLVAYVLSRQLQHIVTSPPARDRSRGAGSDREAYVLAARAQAEQRRDRHARGELQHDARRNRAARPGTFEASNEVSAAKSRSITAPSRKSSG